MKIYCSGTARIKHRDTGKIYEIGSGDLDWEVVGSDERQMGPESHHEAVVDHPELGLLKWGLWEYPVGSKNHQNTDTGGHELVDDFSLGLRHEAPETDDWLDYSTPDDPFGIFMDSYHHTGDLLADYGKDFGGFLINRMMFSHQITAMEAYLGDTLINAVMSDHAVMQRLIEHDNELVKEKFTLVEISKEPGLVKRKVREHLRSVLYHNLAKVDALYNVALGFRILDEVDDKERLFKAVTLRHDCVHRNGFDKEGHQLQIFTKEFVQSTADLIRAFIERVERAVRNRPREAL